MKKLFTITLLLIAMTLSAETSGKDSLEAGSPDSSKVEKPISNTAKGKESNNKTAPQESSTLDLGLYMGIMGCVGFIVALIVLVMSFLSKKRLERRFARLDEKISELKTDFSEQVAEIKDFAEKQTSDVREEVLSEIQSQREMPMDTPPVKKEKIEQLESQNREKGLLCSVSKRGSIF